MQKRQVTQYEKYKTINQNVHTDLTLQCGMTGTALHGENITCRGMMTTSLHAHAFTHSSISQQHR